MRVPITALKPDAVFEVPGAPDWIAIDESVWVSNEPKHTVARLDPKSNKVLALIPVGKEPCSGLTIGFGSLWVPLCGDQALARVDLKEGKVTATIPIWIGDSEGGLAEGAGSIWLVTDKKGTLARIDPATNKVVAEIQVPAGSFTVAFGEGAVWVTGTATNVLTRINPDTNLVVEIDPGRESPALPDHRRRLRLDAESDQRRCVESGSENEQGGGDHRSRCARPRRRDRFR